MTRIDIISGFLGAGKTTLIKKLLGDALKGQQVVLIENEFGEIGIDGGFLKDAGIEIREMNSGCICCSLVGDFGAALKDVITKYHPDRIIIEPSGVGKLSDVIKAVDGVEKEAGVALNSATTVVDVMKCKMYLRNFGEFFENQVKSAGTIILSRTDKADTEKVEAAVKMLRELNPEAHIITTPVEVLGGKKVLDTMEGAIINLEQVEEHHLKANFLIRIVQNRMVDDGKKIFHELRSSPVAGSMVVRMSRNPKEHIPSKNIKMDYHCKKVTIYRPERRKEKHLREKLELTAIYVHESGKKGQNGFC